MSEKFEPYNLEKAQEEASKMQDKIKHPIFGDPKNYESAEALIEYEKNIEEILGEEFKVAEILMEGSLKKMVSIFSKYGNTRVYLLEFIGLKDEAQKLFNFYNESPNNEDKEIGKIFKIGNIKTKGDLYADGRYAMGAKSMKFGKELFKEYNREEKIDILKKISDMIKKSSEEYGNVNYKAAFATEAVGAYELICGLNNPEKNVDWPHFVRKTMLMFQYCFSNKEDQLKHQNKFSQVDTVFREYEENNSQENWVSIQKIFSEYCLEFLEEMAKDRGLEVDHSSIQRWVVKFTPQIENNFRKKKKPTGSSWRMDETYVKIKGKWKYLYRAVDKEGNTVDYLLTAKRDLKAAKRFFKKSIKSNEVPKKINIDKSGSNKAAIEAINEENGINIEIRQCKYLNNIIEGDHRFIKRIIRPMLGFKSFWSASITLAGIEIVRMIKKGQLLQQDNRAQNSYQQFLSLA